MRARHAFLSRTVRYALATDGYEVTTLDRLSYARSFRVVLDASPDAFMFGRLLASIRFRQNAIRKLQGNLQTAIGVSSFS